MNCLISFAIGAFVGVVATLLVMIVSYDRYKEKK